LSWLTPRTDEPGPLARPKITESIHSNTLIDFDDPFKKGNLESVWLIVDKNYKGEITFDAHVKYKSGSAEGKQEIKAESFQGLVDKVNIFINGMKP
jgi:hypothetical protein